MVYLFVIVARQLGRCRLAALLAMGLVLSHFLTQAQVVPTLAPAEKPATGTTYYVDGQLASRADVAKLDSTTILSIDVLKGAAQQRAFGQAASGGTVLITTTAGASSPAVAAFNRRFPLAPATATQNVAIAAATTYMARNYPAAKLLSVGPAEGQPGRYRVIFLESDKRMQLLFDSQGRPVKE